MGQSGTRLRDLEWDGGIHNIPQPDNQHNQDNSQEEVDNEPFHRRPHMLEHKDYIHNHTRKAGPPECQAMVPAVPAQTGRWVPFPHLWSDGRNA